MDDRRRLRPAPSGAASISAEAWIANRELLRADKDAEYAAVIEIDLADIKEPIVCCPNDPDDAKTCPKSPAPRSTKPSSARA